MMLFIQVILGVFDNFWCHEFIEKLPSKPKARHELTFHFIRESIYAVICFGLAWYEWRGSWAITLATLFVTFFIVTMCSFIAANKSRVLPLFERVLHVFLVINISLFLYTIHPILAQWNTKTTTMITVDYGIWSWLFTGFAVVFLIWSMRNAIAVMKLHILKVPEWQRRPFKKGVNENPKKYLITGATGFIGTALTRKLIENGDTVIALSRDKEKVNYKFGPHVQAITNLNHLNNSDEIDVIINLAGESLASGLWTKKRKQIFFESRIKTTKNLITLIERLEKKPELLINGSAIGFYGNRGDETLTEENDSKTDFMASLCQQWEEEAVQAEDCGVRVIRFRIGLVLDGGGGILPPMLLATKLYGGMIIGDGCQYMSWIDRNDIIDLIQFIVSNSEINGAVNASAPNPETQRSFMKTLGTVIKRPVYLWAPQWVCRLLLRDMADLFLNGQKVLPQKAMHFGFKFQYCELRQSFERISSKKGDWGEGCSLVFYDSECSVCESIIDNYCKLKNKADASMDFRAIKSDPDGLQKYGLNKDDIQRRIYVLKSNGDVANGFDAWIEMWSRLPRYQRFARWFQMPLLHFIGEFVYEGMIVPWHAYKIAKQ